MPAGSFTTSASLLILRAIRAGQGEGRNGMSDWNFLNKHRLRTGQFASDESFGFNGAFQFRVAGENRTLRVIASDGMDWQHVSVSFGAVRGTPSWEVMCKVKELFWEPEDWVVQFHPAESEYVNMHHGCLHLWRCLNAEQPKPNSIMVGFK